MDSQISPLRAPCYFFMIILLLFSYYLILNISDNHLSKAFHITQTRFLFFHNQQKWPALDIWIQEQTRQFLPLQKYVTPFSSRFTREIDSSSKRECMSGQNFKRFSVFISICLAALSLSIGATITLHPLEAATLKCECSAPQSNSGFLLVFHFRYFMQRLTK